MDVERHAEQTTAASLPGVPLRSAGRRQAQNTCEATPRAEAMCAHGEEEPGQRRTKRRQ